MRRTGVVLARQWPDWQVAKHVWKTYSEMKVSRENSLRKAVEGSNALLHDVDCMRNERCEVGPLAANAVIQRLCDWRLPRIAEEFWGQVGIPPDANTHILLMQGWAKSGDSAKVEHWMSQRDASGFPRNILCYNAYLSALRKPAEQEMKAVLAALSAKSIPPDGRTAKECLNCCGSVRAACALYDASFKPLLREREANAVFMKIAARHGDVAFISQLLQRQKEATGQTPDVIQLNMLLNAYAENADYLSCVRLLSAMRRNRNAAMAGAGLPRPGSGTPPPAHGDEALLRKANSKPDETVAPPLKTVGRSTPDGQPTAVSFATAIKACAAALDRGSLDQGGRQDVVRSAEAIFELAAASRIVGNQHVFTKLMEVYSHVGDVEGAEHLAKVLAKCRLPMSPPMQRYYDKATGRPPKAGKRRRV
ncbi:hypothetical protein DIPPA_06171 [Diplonema papillatum]|nr:hypothetical protein DIPPA_06171 [Diplonema papillatum]